MHVCPPFREEEDAAEMAGDVLASVARYFGAVERLGGCRKQESVGRACWGDPLTDMCWVLLGSSRSVLLSEPNALAHWTSTLNTDSTPTLVRRPCRQEAADPEAAEAGNASGAEQARFGRAKVAGLCEAYRHLDTSCRDDVGARHLTGRYIQQGFKQLKHGTVSLLKQLGI